MEEEKQICIKNICTYFNFTDSGSKTALMHAITTFFPKNEKIKGSIESTLNKLSYDSLKILSELMWIIMMNNLSQLENVRLETFKLMLPHVYTHKNLDRPIKLEYALRICFGWPNRNNTP
jgi:hypothetical protein